MTVCSAHVEVALGIDVVDYSICGTSRAQVGCHPMELAEKVLSLVVVAHPRKLDERSWLVVRMSRQDLNLLGGDGGAMLDELVVMLPAVSEPMGK